MKWIENSSDRNAEADRWGLWESLASLQNVAIQTTQKPPEGEIGLPNTLKIALMLPEWWKGPTACERVFII